LTTGLIATMTALILGLVTASAKSSFDSLDAAVKHSAADIVTLDRTLARYGPETAPIRTTLRDVVKSRLDMVWPEEATAGAPAAVVDVRNAEGLTEAIRALSPQNDEQRWLQLARWNRRNPCSQSAGRSSAASDRRSRGRSSASWSSGWR
jgi:hypothetical protein